MIPLKDDNPTFRKPIVTYFIIGLCILIFLIQLSTVISRRSEDHNPTSPFEVDEKSIFEEELIEETNTELEQSEKEPSEVELTPSDDIAGTIDEHGFEWLEWPEGSGINYYRKPDSGEPWAIWASE